MSRIAATAGAAAPRALSLAALTTVLVLTGCDDTSKTAATGDPCPEDTEAFRTLVWEPVLAPTCAACHVAGGQAEASGMVYALPGEEGWLEANMAVATAMARADLDGQALLLAKPLGFGNHGGGTLIGAGSKEAEALAFWAEWSRGEVEGCEAPESVSCAAEAPGERLLRRLTPVELDNSVRDVLGVEAGAVGTLAADEVVEGFDNVAAALDVSGLWADQWRGVAENVANEADVLALLPCDPDADGQAPCAALFVEDLGLRLFRRPLAQDDVDRYEALWEEVASEEGFLAGLRWVVAAMLQSPHFLYRMELGARAGDSFALSDWEIAAELSYLYWRTTPDEALLAAAAAGSLQTADGRAAQVARLRADPRAADTVAAFVDAWLQLDDLDLVTRDAEVYPEFSDDIRAAMREETHRLVVDVSDGGTVADLLDARHTWLTPELAAFYGLDAGGAPGEWSRVELDGDRYGGLLTQGSVLATWALPTTSSPVHRGVLVRERLLCQELPPPPANLDTSPPEVDPSLSTRERYAAHAELPQCASCHDRIDPIGFGLEGFDGVGRWRDHDGEHAIDATGAIRWSPRSNAMFDGAIELGELLASSADVQSCYATLWAVWGTGVADDESVRCAAGRLADAAEPGGLALLAPEDAIVTADRFVRRAGEAAELDTPAAGARLDTLVLPADDGPWNDVDWEAAAALVWSVDTNAWGTGFCSTLTVSNSGAAPLDWVVETPLSGSISSSWCVTMTAGDPNTRLSGGGGCGNETLAPGASTTAGWCGVY